MIRVRAAHGAQVAPKYHLSSCIIEKVMSTITDAIFCYITNTSEFTANNRTISTEVYAQRFCVDRNVVLGFDSLQNVLGDSRVQYSIVRDPIDRFLSGFVDKCIKYCNFKDHFDDYVIIRYKKGSHGVSKLADEIDSIFSRAHIPYHIRREIRDQLLGEQHINIFRYIVIQLLLEKLDTKLPALHHIPEHAELCLKTYHSLPLSHVDIDADIANRNFYCFTFIHLHYVM
ncbi:hypothetical protein ANCCEY_11411 [Ancylostoma ceylanicum]|uniref:Sulfotransferase domain-containing protein n=1 Tax=Ancylostoma ceylanicum TaxID=53326 RepID=A0A0D6LBQ5_9BILA|nr:hypothetical protein ANCCEY_11411 [Ancylostoma ceylanicum]